MKHLTLIRVAQTAQYTYGRIEDEEHRELCVTLEEPWRQNQHDVSCIPAGVYDAFRRLSPKRGYEVFELSGVPRRQNVQLHRGNSVADTEGCILLGSRYGPNGTILESKKAFESFMRALLGLERFTLEVKDVAPLAQAAQSPLPHEKAA